MSLSIANSNFLPGLSIIEASAGTGKTYAISHLVPRLLLDGTVDKLSEILLVTFTNDAAGELAERVRSVLTQLNADPAENEDTAMKDIAELRGKYLWDPTQVSRLRTALLDIDTLCVSTIHSFCQRTLQSEGTLCGLPCLPDLITDSSALLEEVIYDLWKERVTRDALLAKLATVQSWNPKADIEFVERFLDLDDPISIPPAGDLPDDSFLQRIEFLRTNLEQLEDAKLARDFQSFAREVDQRKGWHKNYSSVEERQEHLEVLGDSTQRFSDAFFDALDFIAKLSLPGKVVKAAGTELQALARSQAYCRLCATLQEWLAPKTGLLQWHWQHFCAEQVRDKISSSLRENRQITFSGLIETLRTALSDPLHGPALQARLRSQYKVGLIDESQDTDTRQFSIFEKIFLGSPKHRLIMIGDPKQSIYGFRGADLNTYLQAKELHAAEPERNFSLTTTYRAPQELVDCINALFSQENSFLNPKLGFTSAKSGRNGTSLVLDGAPSPDFLEAWIIPDEDQRYFEAAITRETRIVKGVAQTILELLAKGQIQEQSPSGEQLLRKVRPNDIAILVARHDQGSLMAETLRQLGVPVVVSSDSDIMGSEEAAELLSILKAVENPRNSGFRYAALSTRLLGYTSSKIHLLRADPLAEEAELNRFLEWLQLWEKFGISSLFAAMESGMGVSRRLAGLEAGERRATNFRQLTDLLQCTEHAQQLKPTHLLRWMSQELARAGRKASVEERQLQLESDEYAVQVVTMHKSKGLEYNLVFCPFLWWGRIKNQTSLKVLRDSASLGRDTLVHVKLSKDSGDAGIATRMLKAELDERLRIAYVAMTRAKLKLWVAGGALGGRYSNPPVSALDWLLRDAPKVPLDDASFTAWIKAAEQYADAEKGNEGRGARHQRALKRIAGQSKAAISLKALPLLPQNPVHYDPTSLGNTPCRALEAPRLPEAWYITSFSSLTREKHAYDGAGPALPVPPPQQSQPPGIAPDEMPANQFLRSAAGAHIGTLVHDFIETWDFSEPSAEAVHEHLLKSHFKSSKESNEELETQLLSLFATLRLARLPGLPCTLQEACPVAHASEWHFHLPIARTLNAPMLARVFGEYAAPEHRHYADALSQLSDREIGGFLQGFIDRLARLGPCWGVIDWKTNKLGDALDDYHEGALLQCAMDSHYFLQTHLYLVALRRYLRQRGQDYKIVGAWLVFLRATEADSSRGILHIEPPSALLDALDELFLDASPEARTDQAWSLHPDGSAQTQDSP